MLKEQLQAMIQENNILKRAVSIQHERQKEFEDKNQELHNLKQMVSQYQEQLRTLEVNSACFKTFVFSICMIQYLDEVMLEPNKSINISCLSLG